MRKAEHNRGGNREVFHSARWRRFAHRCVVDDIGMTQAKAAVDKWVSFTGSASAWGVNPL